VESTISVHASCGTGVKPFRGDGEVKLTVNLTSTPSYSFREADFRELGGELLSFLNGVAGTNHALEKLDPLLRFVGVSPSCIERRMSSQLTPVTPSSQHPYFTLPPLLLPPCCQQLLPWEFLALPTRDEVAAVEKKREALKQASSPEVPESEPNSLDWTPQAELEKAEKRRRRVEESTHQAVMLARRMRVRRWLLAYNWAEALKFNANAKVCATRTALVT
jgi:hypothetical protein